MGLDMWLYRRKHEDEESDVKVGYWHKFYELYSFIERLKDCYGNNCQEIELDLNDLEEMRKVFIITKQILTPSDRNNLTEEIINKYFLPYHSGSFFSKPMEPEEMNYTIEVLDNAIELTKKGEVIYFYAWW